MGDVRTAAGLFYAEVVSAIQITFVGLMAVSYGAIWIRMKSTTSLIDVNSARYRKSAKMMMIFVVVFIFQWWPMVLASTWLLLAQPPDAVFMIFVVIVNLRGVYNCVAYTLIRRRFKKQQQQAKVTNGPKDATQDK